MNSIDNLREWWRDRFPIMDRQLGCDFREHIDGIEREVKALTDERDLLKTQWEAGVDFDQRLESCAESREDVTLFGVDYTPLPVDADGVPIHVGETVTCVLPFGGESKPFVVDRMELGRDGDGNVWSVALDRSTDCWEQPLLLRHHHAPTVEDVLREFADEVWNRYCNGTTASDSGIRELEAEYAAKLRLAGEDE